MKHPELSIVLPCYNESRNIPLLVEQLSKFWPEVNFELLLVNNGSTDGTENVIDEMIQKYKFIRTVTIEKNIGYGHGILSGLQEAYADIVAYTHADLQTPPEDIFRAYYLFKEEKHNSETILIKGFRVNRRQEEQFLTKGLEKIASLLLGYKMHDINGQPKLFHRKLLEYLCESPKDSSFEVFVMYKAIQNNYKIITFPVDFGLRLYGESKFASTLFKKYKTILVNLQNIFLISIRNLSDKNNPIKQFIKFCLIGGVGAVIWYSTFYLLYKMFSVYYVISSLSGFFVAAFFGFVFNRNWTFNVKKECATKQFIQYILLISLSFTANALSIYFFTDILYIKVEISQLITMGVTTVINYTGSKYWVFKATSYMQNEYN